MIATQTKYGQDGGAEFSECELYRYALWRRWDERLPVLLWILLNPSTADHEKPDPTVTRCINYSKAWGYGGLDLLNIFAFRATNPKDLYVAGDPVGPANDDIIQRYLKDHRIRQLHRTGKGQVMVAWGTHGRVMRRGKAVLKIISGSNIVPMCLNKTMGGHPGHPLYLRANLMPEEWTYA